MTFEEYIRICRFCLFGGDARPEKTRATCSTSQETI